MTQPTTSRLPAIDILRGLAIALMLVDHVREYFYLHLQVGDPMDVAATDPALFFSRLTSHFCAPVFIFLTGLSAWLYGSRQADPRRAASVWLFKRGLFLVALELTVINFAWTFSFPPQMVYLQVIWAIGLSMIALAALLWLPWPALLAFGLAVIGGHNLLAGVHFAPGDTAFVPWAILYERSVIELADGIRARTSYPVLPWVGVIALGYVAGRLYRRDVEPRLRHTVWAWAGTAALAGFIALRAANVYGDLHAWQSGADALHSAMSFLNVTKYPPSLLFLLPTLGLGILLLRWLERGGAAMLAPLAVFGRVPMFFYVVHLYVLHLMYLAAVTIWGEGAGGRFGFDHVWQIWVLSAVLLPFLYLPCRAFGLYKHSSGAAWARYF